jgi:hypothetical protein
MCTVRQYVVSFLVSIYSSYAIVLVCNTNTSIVQLYHNFFHKIYFVSIYKMYQR